MAENPFTAADLAALCAWDTPTICNALELVAPERRGFGYSTRPFVAADPKLPPICGIARVGRIRSAAGSGRGAVADRAARIGWYEHVAAKGDIPTIAVLADLDEPVGIGAFWGEVNSAIHKGLGVAGCVTSGSFRDIGALAPGFQILGGMLNPSHAFVHMVDHGGTVTVHGMECPDGAVVHADLHGAVVIPPAAVGGLLAAIELGARRERVILDMARGRGFDVAQLRSALAQADEIH